MKHADQNTNALDALDARLEGGEAVEAPEVHSFREFLETCARVPVGGGEYGPYTFKGREALIEVVEIVDLIFGSHTGKPLKDATVSLCGGAQFGKSVLELNLGAYVTSCAWLNWGFYLPDKDLVDGMVDTKFRPDVLDQIGWFSEMTQVGKAVNKSGKAVNRKGAFGVTDGKRRSQGMILGLNKIPTSFTFDVTTMDEVDDIKPSREKFVRGRMTSSQIRLMFKIGTQRVAGRGQHKAWKEGSQGIQIFTCPNPNCTHEQNIEENWPKVCRVALDGVAAPSDPYLTNTGDFRHDDNGETIAHHSPEHHYYMACVRCGTQLNMVAFHWKHLMPERVIQRHWSFRISQMGCPAIDISQIVADWQRAVIDPDAMASFLCDRKAMPESTDQKITGNILDRARGVEVYDMLPQRRKDTSAYAGLDTGRRCWFFARETEAIDIKRLLHLEQIALGNVVDRVTTLFHLLDLSALFIDQNPATDEARTLALRLNGLEGMETWPKRPETKDAWIEFPSGLRWDGPNQRWQNLRCAVVAFTKKKIGAGIAHSFDVFEKNGQTMFVPLIECNRFETIDRVVREFLTPSENVSEVIHQPGGKPYIRTQPAMRLPRRGKGAPVVMEALEEHLLVGSERETGTDGTTGDYVDRCENHFLLADGYSALAESQCYRVVAGSAGQFHAFDNRRRRVIKARKDRSIPG